MKHFESGQQITRFPEEEPEVPDVCCQKCKFCSALVRPRELSGGGAIYGYCFKNGTKEYSLNIGKGYPIYIELTGGGACKDFRKIGRQ